VQCTLNIRTDVKEGTASATVAGCSPPCFEGTVDKSPPRRGNAIPRLRPVHQLAVATVNKRLMHYILLAALTLHRVFVGYILEAAFAQRSRLPGRVECFTAVALLVSCIVCSCMGYYGCFCLGIQHKQL
jgi:hypothetical protein